MSCVSGLANTILFVFNILCAFVGWVLIIVGSIFYVAIDKYYEMAENNLNVAPALAIVIGVIVFIIAFLGCCGLTKENRWMLFTYATILLILFTLQIAAGTYGYVQVNNNGGDLKVTIHKAVKAAFSHYYDTKELFDIMQLQLKCCGVDSPRDYNFYLTIPSSCCGHTDETKFCLFSPGKIYIEGCSTKLFTFLVDSVKIVANVAFGIAAIELIGAMFAIYLGKRLGDY